MKAINVWSEYKAGSFKDEVLEIKSALDALDLKLSDKKLIETIASCVEAEVRPQPASNLEELGDKIEDYVTNYDVVFHVDRSNVVLKIINEAENSFYG